MDKFPVGSKVRLNNMPGLSALYNGTIGKVIDGKQVRLCQDPDGMLHHVITYLVMTDLLGEVALIESWMEFVAPPDCLRHDHHKVSWSACAWQPNPITLKAMGNHRLRKYFGH